MNWQHHQQFLSAKNKPAAIRDGTSVYGFLNITLLYLAIHFYSFETELHMMQDEYSK